jgi:hypothetical protein
MKHRPNGSTAGSHFAAAEIHDTIRLRWYIEPADHHGAAMTGTTRRQGRQFP